MTENELIEMARTAAKNSYSPYSNFPVGSAVLAGDGEIYLGCNIENASYGLTVCGERAAIFNAVANGNKKIKMIATTCMKGDKNDPNSLMSCGACRQVISEFITDDGVILIDGVGRFDIDQFLPLRFRLPQ